MGSDSVDSVESRRVVLPWRLIESGLWVRLAFAGVMGAFLGLRLLFTGEAEPSMASLWALGGALVGGYSARRSWVLVYRSDRAGAEEFGVRLPGDRLRWNVM